jgi:hypothetical protein
MVLESTILKTGCGKLQYDTATLLEYLKGNVGAGKGK